MNIDCNGFCILHRDSHDMLISAQEIFILFKRIVAMCVWKRMCECACEWDWTCQREHDCSNVITILVLVVIRVFVVSCILYLCCLSVVKFLFILSPSQFRLDPPGLWGCLNNSANFTQRPCKFAACLVASTLCRCVRSLNPLLGLVYRDEA